MAVLTHEAAMRLALAEAERARDLGEVPIGAVVISAESLLIGTGCNRPISAVDPTAHAEINAMRAAAQSMRNYRLTGCTLYVTVEPCLMCVGAIVHARVGLVVYGAVEPKTGALVSSMRAHESLGLNHRVEVIGGVLEEDCRDIIQGFFKSKRL
jgi:tRNA(adenine34) deaminase